jgi:hypothetical protein
MLDDLKWGVSIGGLITFIALVMFALAGHKDIVADQAKIDKHDACIAALGGKGDVATKCDPAIIVYYDRARHDATCDKGLALGGLAPECSAAVADLFAVNATLKTQLQSTVADRDAAIARAAARATTDAQRKSQDARALAAAPRQPDGLIDCDAQCLRQRFEADAAH